MTETPGADDDWTEIFDADIPRVDLVGKGANGIPFVLAKQDANGGLFGPEFIRSLLAKTSDEPGSTGREQVTVPTTTLPNGVTLNGSAAEIAEFIHKAAVAHEVVKAEQSTATQNDLPDSDFAYIEPGGKKDADGKTTPRSLRHFPVNDAVHVRNALARAPQSPFGDKAMPKIRAAAKKFGVEVSKQAVAKDTGDALDAATDDGVDGLDPTVPAAAPDGLDDIPGDPADPGSSAWEAVDSATAAKWCAILAGAQRAISWLQDRELLEAATADPDDAGNACDLDSACQALDYAIGVLAPYAVSEQSESDRLAFEAEVSKSAVTPSSTLHAVVAIAKAGRVLSSANEQRIRNAAGALNEVLASLPQAPDAGGPAAVIKEEGDVPKTSTAAQDVAKETDVPAEEAEGVEKAEGAETPAAADTPAETGDIAKSAEPARMIPVYSQSRDLTGVMSTADLVTDIAKASGDGDKPAMMAVFDANGDLIGIVDPSAITPVQGAGKKDSGDSAPDPEPKPDDGSGDMTPQPSADAGTAADGSTDDDDDVAKAAEPADGSEENNPMAEVLKSITQLQGLFETNETARTEVVAKMAADNATLVEQLEEVRKRLATVEEQPAAPKVFTNGQVPPAHQLRGQDQGTVPVDVAKAAERRRRLYQSSDAGEQNTVAKEMMGDAFDAIAAIHAGRR